MRYHIAALLLAFTVPLLGACGQMGPLYMPEEDPRQPSSAEQTDDSESQTSAP